MSEIDFDGPVPVYLQLAALLRAQIASGELPADRPIPSKRDLVQRYEVGRGTIDHAVQVLKDAGLVYTVIGRGVYVTDPDDMP
jgi:GntR family transcriptional regulator